jgi:hypothetical protein
MIFGLGTLTGLETLAGSGTLTGHQWDHLISSGIRFASEVCLSIDNHISNEFADNLKIEPCYRISS